MKLSKNQRRANKIARRLQQMDDHARHAESHAKRMNHRSAPLPILETALIESDQHGLHISYTDLETAITKTVPATYGDVAPAEFEEHLESSPLAAEAQIISAGAICICPRTLDEIAANAASHGRSPLYMEAPADETHTLRIRDYFGRFNLRGYSADEYPPVNRAAGAGSDPRFAGQAIEEADHHLDAAYRRTRGNRNRHAQRAPQPIFLFA